MKLSNAALRAKLFAVAGALDVLVALGFVPEGAEVLVLPPGALLPAGLTARIAALRPATPPTPEMIAAAERAEAQAQNLKRQAEAKAERERIAQQLRRDADERKEREATRVIRASVAVPKGPGTQVKFEAPKGGGG